MDWGRKCLVDVHVGKTRLVYTGAVDVKMDGSVLEEKSSFKMLGLTFSSKLDWSSYITCIAKTISKKISALTCSLSHEVALYLYKSTIWPCMEYCFHVWAGAPGVTCNCWISYKNYMQDCWYFTFCLSWTLGLSSKCSQLKFFLQILLW